MIINTSVALNHALIFSYYFLSEHDITNESQNSPSSKIRNNDKNPFLDPNIRRDNSASSSRERVEKLYDQYQKRKDMSKSPRSYEYQGIFIQQHKLSRTAQLNLVGLVCPFD